MLSNLPPITILKMDSTANVFCECSKNFKIAVRALMAVSLSIKVTEENFVFCNSVDNYITWIVCTEN